MPMILIWKASTVPPAHSILYPTCLDAMPESRADAAACLHVQLNKASCLISGTFCANNSWFMLAILLPVLRLVLRRKRRLCRSM